MLRELSLLAGGLFAWTIIEYVVHGVLAHSHRTPITKIHSVHHADSARVFTIRAWPWVALVYLTGLVYPGFSSAPMLFLTGILLGFLAYETMHYRFHFARPANAIEAQLRARHLAHHMGAPNSYFGVTSPLWDRILGSVPEPDRRAKLEARAAQIAPLTCRTNIERITRYFC